MVAENVKNIRERIAVACARIGRRPEEITLIGVAKTFGSDMIREALRAGIADIGENYVQELERKKNELTGEALRWHFIGHLQSNKVKNVVGTVEWIHSVDSASLGREIARRASGNGRTVRVLIEVNTSGESSKFGVRPEEAADLARNLSGLQGIDLAGFMTIGRFSENPEESRPPFRLLRKLQMDLDRQGLRLPHLSMGMTHDFEVAIEEGATMIRIGTAIFGSRTRKGSIAVSPNGTGG